MLKVKLAAGLLLVVCGVCFLMCWSGRYERQLLRYRNEFWARVVTAPTKSDLRILLDFYPDPANDVHAGVWDGDNGRILPMFPSDAERTRYRQALESAVQRDEVFLLCEDNDTLSARKGNYPYRHFADRHGRVLVTRSEAKRKVLPLSTCSIAFTLSKQEETERQTYRLEHDVAGLGPKFTEVRHRGTGTLEIRRGSDLLLKLGPIVCEDPPFREKKGLTEMEFNWDMEVMVRMVELLSKADVLALKSRYAPLDLVFPESQTMWSPQQRLDRDTRERIAALVHIGWTKGILEVRRMHVWSEVDWRVAAEGFGLPIE